MDETKSGARRLGFMLPLVLFVLFFIICCGVLSSVFAKSADLSIQAQQLNTAVQLCRNGAEVYAACGSLEQTEKTLGGTFFDNNGTPVEKKDARLYLTMEEKDGEYGVRYAVMEAYSAEGEFLYTLTAASYSGE